MKTNNGLTWKDKNGNDVTMDVHPSALDGPQIGAVMVEGNKLVDVDLNFDYSQYPAAPLESFAGAYANGPMSEFRKYFISHIPIEYPSPVTPPNNMVVLSAEGVYKLRNEVGLKFLCSGTAMTSMLDYDYYNGSYGKKVIVRQYYTNPNSYIKLQMNSVVITATYAEYTAWRYQNTIFVTGWCKASTTGAISGFSFDIDVNTGTFAIGATGSVPVYAYGQNCL